MKKFTMLKRISFLTAFTLTISSVSSLSSFAEEETSPEQSIDFNSESVLTSEEREEIASEVQLDAYVLSEDFDLVEEVENTPSLQEMTDDQKQVFDQILEEQVALSGIEDKEEAKLFEEALVDFFDEVSDTYDDLLGAQENLEEAVEEVQSENSAQQDSFVETAFTDTFGIRSADAAIEVKVGVKFAGAVFNMLIGIAVGGGVGAIQSFIIKKGKDAAAKLFTRTVVSRLQAWGANKLALTVGVCVTTALNYLDIGTKIASLIDKKDKKPNNGWINIY